jgi:hypothetical protein
VAGRASSLAEQLLPEKIVLGTELRNPHFRQEFHMTTRNRIPLFVYLFLCGLTFQPACAQEKKEQNVDKKVDQTALTADLLTPMRVRFDWKDVPVRTAFADLAKKSTCVFDFDGDGKWIDKRRVTLDTGDVTFWEAVHALCQKAGLTEQVNDKAAQRTIVLSDKIPPEAPLHFAGSVRIRAMQPTKDVPAGESLFILDVAGEARLRPFGIVGAISVDRAVDDQGRILTPIEDLAPKAPPPAKPRGLPREMKQSGGVCELIGFDLDPVVNETPLRRSVPVRFKTGDKPVKMLKEISGKVRVQSLAKPELVITFKDPAKAVGKTQSAEGYTLVIDDFEKTDDGRVKIKVTLTAPQGPFVGDKPFNALFGDGKVLVDGVPLSELPGGGGRPAPTMPKLVDADGKVYQPRVANLKTTALNNNRCCSDLIMNGTPLTQILPGDFEHQATLVFSPSAEPASLQLHGQKLVTCTVPFELKNVLLTSGK